MYYLVTGANRGIGRALANRIIARNDITLLALVRDPSSETSRSLAESQARGSNSKVVMIQYDAHDMTSARRAVEEAQSQHGVTQLDVVVANAGVGKYFGPTIQSTADMYMEHFIVNTLGPFTLFQATSALLERANTTGSATQGAGGAGGKFIAISSAGGSIAMLGQPQLRRDTQGRRRPGAEPYSASKAALNHIMCRLNAELPGITVGVLTPGATKTGLGDGAVNWDLVPNAQDADTVATGLIQRIDDVVKAEDGNPVFTDWKGDVIPW